MQREFPEKVFLETDVLTEYLTKKHKDSILLELMQNSICFTSVINASELFIAAGNESQNDTVQKLLTGLKVIGIHSRYSLLINKYSSLVNTVRDALICVLAEYNKLPIVTYKKERFIKTRLTLIDPKKIRGKSVSG
jgi:predicted nucleic acid-binding protein